MRQSKLPGGGRGPTTLPVRTNDHAPTPSPFRWHPRRGQAKSQTEGAPLQANPKKGKKKGVGDPTENDLLGTNDVGTVGDQVKTEPHLDARRPRPSTPTGSGPSAFYTLSATIRTGQPGRHRGLVACVPGIAGKTGSEQPIRSPRPGSWGLGRKVNPGNTAAGAHRPRH